jgi:hypothetical protein
LACQSRKGQTAPFAAKDPRAPDKVKQGLPRHAPCPPPSPAISRPASARDSTVSLALLPETLLAPVQSMTSQDTASRIKRLQALCASTRLVKTYRSRICGLNRAIEVAGQIGKS